MMVSPSEGSPPEENILQQAVRRVRASNEAQQGILALLFEYASRHISFATANDFLDEFLPLIPPQLFVIKTFLCHLASYDHCDIS
jgi:hypothetical protein